MIYELLEVSSRQSTPEHIKSILSNRLEQLKSMGEPFTAPSTTSRARVESGEVTITEAEHKTVIKVESEEKVIVVKISERFKLDEVESLLLLKRYLRSEQLPLHFLTSKSNRPSTSSDVTEDLLDSLNVF